MKKFALIFAMLLALTLTACAGRSTAAKGGVQSVVMTDVWPANDYTEGLPVPPGTVTWTLLDAARGICGVSLTDVSESGCRDYMAALKQAGFFAVAAVSEARKGQNDVSAGALLSNGEKELSVSYIPGQITISISMEK